MDQIRKRLAVLGFTDDEQDKWLNSYVKALSPTYSEDTTPQQLIDAGKDDIVLSLLDEIESGFAL